MFSPIGYRSLVHIRNRVNELYEEEPYNLESLFQFAFEQDEGAWSRNLAMRFSKREVLELTLFELLKETELFLYSPEGGIVHMEVPLYLNLIEYRHLKYEPLLEDEYFERSVDWPGHEAELDKALAEHKDPWTETFASFPNTSINLFYNRETFLVDKTEHDGLSHYTHGHLFLESLGYPFGADTVTGFVGWSMCAPEAFLLKLTKDLVRQTFFKVVFNAVFGHGAFENNIADEPEKLKVGRPLKRIEAAEAFLRHFNWDSKPNWKVVERVLLEKEGLDVSRKTISRGLAELERDKKKDKSRPELKP